MSSPTATVYDGVGAGATPITEIHPDIIKSHVLNRLDGLTLAATSCASGEMLALCNDDDCLWKHICNAAWPSTADRRVRDAVAAFPFGHRSFFSDSFPARRHHQLLQKSHPPAGTPELISAVDIYYDDHVIISKVLVTETQSPWFLSTPFRLDLLDPKETVAVSSSGASDERAAERLRVSWILIDPAKNRSINVASRSAVEVRRHWLMNDVQLRFTTVVSSGGEPVQCGVVVTFDGERVKEVSMRIEETEGKIVTGMEGLGVLAAAMEGRKVKLRWRSEKELYEAFVRMKTQFRERKQKRERGLDMACFAAGVLIFAAGVVWAVFSFNVYIKIKINY